MSNLARWETAEASDMTPIEGSSPEVVTGSLHDVEPEISQVKKRKKERETVMQDAKSGYCGDGSSISNSFLPEGLCLESEVCIGTKSDLKSGVPRDSCLEPEVDMGTDAGSKTAEASEMTHTENGSLKLVGDSLCKVELEISQGNKRQKLMQDPQSDPPGDISSIKSSPLQRDLCLKSELHISTKLDLKSGQTSDMTPINDTSGPVVKKISQAEKKKNKRPIEVQDDGKSDPSGEVSSLDNSSLQRDSCSETAVDASSKVDFERVQPSMTPIRYSSQVVLTEPLDESVRAVKMRKNMKIMPDVQADLPGDISSINNSSIRGDSCCESEVDICTNEDLKTGQSSQISSRHDALGNNTQPIVQTCDGSANILDVPQVDVHISSVKDVQGNLDEKGSSLSNDMVGFEENGEMTITKTNVDFDGPIMEQNTQQVPHFSPKGSHTICSNRKLLILDINGLLADIVPSSYFGPKPDIRISQKSVFKRPFCDDFLQFCFEKFDVGVWSSRTEKNVELAVDYLFGDLKDKLIFCWDQYHCTKTGFQTIENRDKPLILKELKKLWKHLKSLTGNKGEYDESNTLLLDDSPYKALTNPVHNCLFPRSYTHRARRDTSIGPGGDLRVYLEGLAEAPNVSEFVAHKPFGQQAITKSSRSWGFYEKILQSLQHSSD